MSADADVEQVIADLTVELDAAALVQRNGRHPDDPGPTEPPPDEQTQPRNGADRDKLPAQEQPVPATVIAKTFFDRDGLRARTLADAAMDSIPCGYNLTDDKLYVYEEGVWVPNRGAIETVIAAFLADRYRQGHCRNALDLIRYSPKTPRIDCIPQPRYINVANGMLDWDNGTLVQHSPDFLSTVQLPVAYDADATCPEFEKFLIEVLPEDCLTPTDDGPGFIWELLAYVVYSGNPLHIAILLYGKGRNGKGTLVRLIKHLLGERNCTDAKLHELAENRFRAATLYGKLANLAGDLDARWLTNTAVFKSITGGDSIQGEHKYGAVFNFTPWALPFYSTNRAFGSSDSSEGWMARWVVVPFPNSFLGQEDRGLDQRLQTDNELRGVLAKAVAALPSLIARGRLTEPKSVAEAKTDFMRDADAVRGWLLDNCEFDEDCWVNRTQLYRAYLRDEDNKGPHQLTARDFYGRVLQIGKIRHAVRTGERGFAGIKLRGQDRDSGK